MPEDECPSLAKRAEDLPVQGKVSQEGGNGETKGEGTEAEKPEVSWSKEDEAQKVVGPPNPNQPPREIKPSTLSPQMLRRTEVRRRLGQNKAFLPALGRALTKAREKLA